MSPILCFVCDLEVDLDEAHWPHQADCDGECWCLTVTCPDCCFECRNVSGAALAGDVARDGQSGAPGGPVAHTTPTPPTGPPDPRKDGSPGACNAGASNPTREHDTNGAIQ